MKLVGIELRVGVQGPMMEGRQLEVAVFPVNVVYPGVKGRYDIRPTAEITFHTTEGDVTTNVSLPMDYDRNPILLKDEEIYPFLRKQLHA